MMFYVKSAVSVLSCVWILLIISLSGILFVFALAWKYKSFRVPSSDGKDSWLTFALLCGSLLAHSSVFPFAARVYALVQIPTSIKTETQIQVAVWLLSVGCSLVFGSQAILAWKRWKIQNSYLNIRHQYLALILCMIVLVDVSQLTLWSSTDPFRCSATPASAQSTRSAPDSSLVFCSVHYLPLWLLSNFLHKGVLIFTATVYSWRLQLLSTSISILRSISGCSLLSSSAAVISIALLSPLVYIANQSPALQHLCLSLAILLAIGSTSIFHFIPKILTAHVHREQQVQVRQATMGDMAGSPLFPEVHGGGLKKVKKTSELRRPSASSLSQHQQLQSQQPLQMNQNHHRRESSSITGRNISFMNPDRLENLLKVPQDSPHKKSIRVGSTRDLMMKARQHHKSMFQLGYTAAGYPSSDSHNSRIEMSRQSQCQSSASSSRHPPHQPQNSHRHHMSRQNLKYKNDKQPVNSAIQQLANPLNTRIRKSFSLNDMKAFLRDTKRSDAMILDSRDPEPVAYTSENLLRPLITQPATVETPSISPNSTSRQGSQTHGTAPLTEEESTSLASKMWLTPSILRSNPINFIRLGSVTSQMSVKQTDDPVII
ncbi:Oidioi.mRNA.OKI2018_I69.PAR.g11696.t1.cds [Oikopleura dioica]|uniref:Oidioi.mRNA.OKI2018_I69.PAR.g11696.t1.cds n=1 Tax=Oikopleura dioica TaxID=34765 RepID=A0ABN7RXB6_OIKDI|nr:Oidioi.mRNA.OKI2018_I69.PAR.g11696.t1.cds [Oikopleura dioica]